MKKIANFFFPQHVQILFKRLGISLLILQICRWLFWLFNISILQDVSFMDFYWGTWFDLMTLGIIYIPFYIIFLLPFPYQWRESKIFKTSFKVLFHLINTIIILTNLLDLEYYQYTLKRSTADLFTMIGMGEDVWNLIPDFLADFWLVIVLMFLLIIVSEWLYRKTQKIKLDRIKYPTWWQSTILLLFFTTVFFIIGRGGLQLKPRGIISAAQYTSPDKTALVLNTTFSIIKTWNKQVLERKNYFKKEELKNYFTPVSQYNTQGELEGNNVIILVLESFTQEAMTSYNAQKSYTPFLDSLFSESLVFKNVYANGKRSIDGIPAITTGIPTLMENSFISSPYATNQSTTLIEVLHKIGYSSAFFHGATNGSMNFDGYAAWAGYESYNGRSEYNNEDHYDGSWGIFDEYFLPWTAKKINAMKSPFFATIFTISSHHPYEIPPHHKDKFNISNEPMWNSIAYADYSLSLFFKAAQKYNWFENTLFVITADHTPVGVKDYYKRRTGMYAIPLAFYHPKMKLSANKNKVVQQADIPTSILDIIGAQKPFYSFGNSVFVDESGYSVSYLQGIYNYFSGNYALLYDSGEESIYGLYDLRVDSLLKSNIYVDHEELGDSLTNKLKAIIQTYNNDLIDNKMIVQ